MADLHRLVYSPKAWVYIRTQERGIVDVSDFVSAGEVNRVVNEVSTATVTLRNAPDPTGELGSPHYGRFTVNPRAQVGDKDAKPWFHPMDPITIYLARFADKPVQVFTGYLDTTPYVQLFPGTITLQASCTLKRLLYTFWDPALPFTRDFLGQFGWISDVSSGQLINYNATEKQLDARDPRLTDSGFGDLLYVVLNRIGGWRDDQIHIEQLPEGIINTVTGIYNSLLSGNEQAQQQFSELLSRMIGTSGSGSAGGNDQAVGADASGTLAGLKFTHGQQVFAQTLAPLLNYDIRVIGAWMYQEMNGQAALDREAQGNHDWLNIDRGNRNFTTPSPIGNDPARAAQWTYSWITGATSPHGDPTTIKQPILSASGKGAQAELQAIASSAWCAPKYDVTGLQNLFKQITANVNAGTSPAHTGQGGTSTSDTTTKTVSAKGKKGGDTKQKGSNKFIQPVPNATKNIISPWGQNRGNHLHAGVDIAVPVGTKVVAVLDGTATVDTTSDPGGYGWFITIDHNNGLWSRYAHLSQIKIKNGQDVTAGQMIGLSGGQPGAPGAGDASGPHLHFEVRKNAGFGFEGTVDPTTYLNGAASPAPGVNVDGGSSSTTTSTTDGSILPTSTAAAFATSIEFPGVEETIEAIALQGQKSLMNDKPLLPFIQQLSGASLRQFMSLPNGSFIAFYPDFFGTYGHRAPYWQIDDIEILDGKIELSDDALATHVYVVGDTFPFIGGPGELVNKLASGGVVTIFNAFNSGDWMIVGDKSALGASTAIPKASQGKGKKDRKRGSQPALNTVQNINSKKSIFGDTGQALAFLQKFGARPLYQEEPFIRSPYFEAFMAFTLFQLAWSKQFLTTFSLTFMPELYPGGRVAFPNHDFACYIDAVTHSFDYTNGFTTSANFSAPSAYVAAGKPGDPPPIPDNPIAQGMIRSLDPLTPKAASGQADGRS